jgi:hypothetical protein
MSTNKPTRKRPLGSPRPKGKENIRIDLKEVGVIVRSLIDSYWGKVYWRALKMWH